MTATLRAVGRFEVVEQIADSLCNVDPTRYGLVRWPSVRVVEVPVPVLTIPSHGTDVLSRTLHRDDVIALLCFFERDFPWPANPTLNNYIDERYRCSRDCDHFYPADAIDN